jgi:hypothetical protein
LRKQSEIGLNLPSPTPHGAGTGGYRLTPYERSACTR